MTSPLPTQAKSACAFPDRAALARRLAKGLALPARRRRELARLAQTAFLAGEKHRSHAPFVWGMLGGLAYACFNFGAAGGIAASLALFACLTLTGLFDARYYVIPDVQSAALAAGGLLQALAAAPAQAPDRIAGVLAGYACLRLVAAAYRRWRGVDGMGQGDAKLLAAGGAWIGLAGLPACLALASLSGLLAALVLMRGSPLRAGRQTAIPFGPHLCLAIWAVWLFGPLAQA